jgi:hypothetical protein
MDAETLRTVADLARKRAARSSAGSSADGLMRLGAKPALIQLAADLQPLSSSPVGASPAPNAKLPLPTFRHPQALQ